MITSPKAHKIIFKRSWWLALQTPNKLLFKSLWDSIWRLLMTCSPKALNDLLILSKSLWWPLQKLMRLYLKAPDDSMTFQRLNDLLVLSKSLWLLVQRFMRVYLKDADDMLAKGSMTYWYFPKAYDDISKSSWLALLIMTYSWSVHDFQSQHLIQVCTVCLQMCLAHIHTIISGFSTSA